MLDITVDSLKKLRKYTGMSIMECRKALIKSQGNIELAIDNVRISGKLKALKKICRIAKEGIILTKIEKNRKYGVIIELNCETDFVTKDKIFQDFGNDIVTKAINEHINDIEILKLKFENRRTDLISNFGENINIRRFRLIEGDRIGSYLHNTKIGVLLSSTCTNDELLKQIAMHIAASNPLYISENDVPTNVLSNERQIQLNIAINSGKSNEIAEKIVNGRMCKFIDKITLRRQSFIMDMSKTIDQLLNEYDANINNFVRFEIGE